jgi:hypothetical protein
VRGAKAGEEEFMETSRDDMKSRLSRASKRSKKQQDS